MNRSGQERKAPARPASLWRSIKMIAWAFFGIRKNSESHEDGEKINPLHVLLVGFVGVVIIVVGLIVLVNWVVA